MADETNTKNGPDKVNKYINHRFDGFLSHLPVQVQSNCEASKQVCLSPLYRMCLFLRWWYV